jgi:hypothetical protein
MSPTPQQIQAVKTNLANMQAFNDYMYTNGLARVANAYDLLTETDENNPGLTVILNVIEGGFWAAGSELGPAGNFFASFLSGMLSYWATDTPPSLTGQFVNFRTCFQETHIQVDKQLATYFQDVPKYWNTSFAYNGKTAALSDLATSSFPAETDPRFETMAEASIVAFDRALWTNMLTSKFVISYWRGTGIVAGNRNTPPEWIAPFYKNNPAYYITWWWHEKNGCGDTTGWMLAEKSVGSHASAFRDGALNADACAYLFQDSLPGTIINPKALFTREQVFAMNLPVEIATHSTPLAATVRANSVAYLRAMKEGKTLGILVATEGRAAVEKRVLAHADADPVFRHNLSMRPRQTLEQFLGVQIPELVSLNVVVEDSRTFGLVIPAQES